jgi:hypothetical protein
LAGHHKRHARPDLAKHSRVHHYRSARVHALAGSEEVNPIRDVSLDAISNGVNEMIL